MKCLKQKFHIEFQNIWLETKVIYHEGSNFQYLKQKEPFWKPKLDLVAMGFIEVIMILILIWTDYFSVSVLRQVSNYK